jgi:hypothetical protein
MTAAATQDRVRASFTPAVSFIQRFGRWSISFVRDRAVVQQLVEESLGFARSRGRTTFTDGELEHIGAAASANGYAIETITQESASAKR